MQKYFQYWGKADEKYNGEPKWHPLAYHCIDVAAVAAAWWDASPSVRRTFLVSFNCQEPQKLRAWVMLFVALHDLGKFDVRFQLKAPDALAAAWRSLQAKDHGLSRKEIAEFDHGWAGMAWANQEYLTWTNCAEPYREIWGQWKPWLAAVTGHHGDFPTPSMPGLQPDTDEMIIDHDRNARREFVTASARIFLSPVGLTLEDVPPACSTSTQSWLAGFCSVCDWVGSNAEVFRYHPPDAALPDYLKHCVRIIEEEKILHRFGLVERTSNYQGVHALLKADEFPHGVQVEMDCLPATSGLTLIEAPTGSGKTEAALAYAWRLLDQGVGVPRVSGDEPFEEATEKVPGVFLQNAGRLESRLVPADKSGAGEN